MYFSSIHVNQSCNLGLRRGTFIDDVSNNEGRDANTQSPNCSTRRVTRLVMCSSASTGKLSSIKSSCSMRRRSVAEGYAYRISITRPQFLHGFFLCWMNELCCSADPVRSVWIKSNLSRLSSPPISATVVRIFMFPRFPVGRGFPLNAPIVDVHIRHPRIIGMFDDKTSVFEKSLRPSAIVWFSSHIWCSAKTQRCGEDSDGRSAAGLRSQPRKQP